MRLIPGNHQIRGARENQEDAFAFLNIGDDVASGALAVAVVSDGMGGLEGGERASRAAIKAFLDEIRNDGAGSIESGDIRSLMTSAISVANKAVLQVAESIQSRQAGATLCAAIIEGNDLHWASVGDSRLYLLRGGKCHQLTDDHVYGNTLDKMAAEGKISPVEAAQHPERESLESYLGLDNIPKISTNGDPFTLKNDDILFLCSDGVYNVISNDELITIFDECADIQASVEGIFALIEQKEYPGQDNATIAALHVEPSLTKQNGHIPHIRNAKTVLFLSIILLALSCYYSWSQDLWSLNIFMLLDAHEATQ